jgi:hypothetical protein
MALSLKCRTSGFNILIVFVLTIAMQGCNGLNKAIRATRSSRIEVKRDLTLIGDTIYADIRIDPIKELRSKEEIRSFRNIFFSYDTGRIVRERLATIELKKIQIPEDCKLKLPYDTNKVFGSLMMQDSVINLSKNKVMLDYLYRIESRVDISSSLVTKVNLKPETILTKAPEPEQREFSGVPTSVFRKGSDVFVDRVGYRKDMQEFFSHYSKLHVDSGFSLPTIRTVTVTAYESPDEFDSGIALTRAAAAGSVVTDALRSLPKKYNDIKVILKPVSSDWTEFKTELAVDTFVPDSVKMEYLNVINSTKSSQQALVAMHSLPSYTYVVSKIFPRTRKVKTEMLTVSARKTDAEISVLAKQITAYNLPMDTLTPKEMMYAATLTQSYDEKKAIYSRLIQALDYTDAKNNLAALEIERFKQTSDQSAIDNANRLLKPSTDKSFAASYNTLLKDFLQGLAPHDISPAMLMAQASTTSEKARANLLTTSYHFRSGNFDQLTENSTGRFLLEQDKVLHAFANARNRQNKEALALIEQTDRTYLSNSENAILEFTKAIAEFNLNEDADQFVSSVNVALSYDQSFSKFIATDKDFEKISSELAPWKLPPTLCNNYIPVRQMKLLSLTQKGLAHKIVNALQENKYQSIKTFEIPPSDGSGFFIMHGIEKFDRRSGKSIEKDRFNGKFTSWFDLPLSEKAAALIMRQVQFHRAIVFVYLDKPVEIVDSEKTITSQNYNSFLIRRDVEITNKAVNADSRLYIYVYEFAQGEGDTVYKLTDVLDDWEKHLDNSKLLKSLTK